MSHPADITVVIPAFNAADSIGGQLEALSQQVDSPAFDIIVADNLSTDGTREAALAWSDRVPGDLRVVRADKTQGPSHA
ncbi:glycosyltransferase, partial [Amycolatopsis sp. H6(2020)]|nr:glycosyltransferase [Amycolatopsis sp. H6(2020)]